MPRISLPPYSSSRHPIETWQEWYRHNQAAINRQVHHQIHSHPTSSDEIRLLAPYEYTDSLNQRQIWEPYLTGRERQEFDAQLRTFMKQNRTTMLRLRPGPTSPPTSSYQTSKSRGGSRSGASSAGGSSNYYYQRQ